MQNESALLLRLQQNQQLTSPLLLINPPDDPGIYHALDIVGVLHDSYTRYMHWQNSDTPSWFACHLPDEEFSTTNDITVVLFLPKGKQRLLAQLQLLAGRIPTGTRLVVIGAIDIGIKSAGKKIADYCDNVQKMDAARHCQAWSGKLQDLPLVELDSLFTSWPLEINDKILSISSLPGVFSDGRLDTGSRLLMETLEKQRDDLPHKAKVLDFGCGSGVLSTAIGNLLPNASITAVDNDAFALLAANKTFQKNSINAKTQPTATPTDLNGQYQLIISNPPFHQGTSQSTAITIAFIQRLSELLAPRGQAWVVANRFLNYEDICEQARLNVNREAENRAYKILAIQNQLNKKPPNK